MNARTRPVGAPIVLIAVLASALLCGCEVPRKELITFPDGSTQARWLLIQDGDQWIPHGPYVEYHDNREKAATGFFRRGEKHGTWRTWYENGDVESVTRYRDGHRHGTCTLWYAGAGRQWEATFRAGRKDGTETRWYPNGEREWAGVFENDAMLSYTSWSPTGRVVEEFSRDRGIVRPTHDEVPPVGAEPGGGKNARVPGRSG